MKIIYNQLDINLGQFTQEELNILKTGKLPPSMKYFQKYGKQGNSMANCYDTATPCITRDGQKAVSFLFSKKGDLGIAKNYWDITLTSIAAKIYNALLLTYIEQEIERILRKNQIFFSRNRSTTSQILTSHWILGVSAKNLEVTLLFVDFSKAFDSMDGANTSSLWFPWRNRRRHNNTQ